jgi:hypothetical protein
MTPGVGEDLEDDVGTGGRRLVTDLDQLSAGLGGGVRPGLGTGVDGQQGRVGPHLVAGAYVQLEADGGVDDVTGALPAGAELARDLAKATRINRDDHTAAVCWQELADRSGREHASGVVDEGTRPTLCLDPFPKLFQPRS